MVHRIRVMEVNALKLKKDQVTGIVLTILGAYLWITASQFPAAKTEGDPGPGFLPILCGIALIVCGILLFVQGRNKEDKIFLTKEQWKKLLIMFAVFVGFWLGLKYLGFLITVPVILFLLSTIMAKGQAVPWWHKALFAALTTAVFFVLFRVILKVRLPEGELISLLFDK